MCEPYVSAGGAAMWLVALKGFAGSGKSTLGRGLGRQRGWPLIDKDDIKDILDGQTAEAGRLAYDAMFRVARRQLRQGLSVICDSPLSYVGLYEQARSIAAETRATLVVVECRCPDEQVWRERINARQALNLPAHHQTDWDRYMSVLDGQRAQMAYPIDAPHLVVDTNRPLPEVVAEVLAWLDQHRPGSLSAGA